MSIIIALRIVAGIVVLAIWNFKGLPGIFKAYLEFSRPNWNLQQFSRRSMVSDNNCNNYMVDKILMPEMLYALLLAVTYTFQPGMLM